MPSYEMAMIVKSLQKPEVAVVVKRACKTVMERGGLIRSLEHLGTKKLPYRMAKHGEKYHHGVYFLVNFDSPPRIITDLMDELGRDIDIIRPSVLEKEEEFDRPCRYGPCVFGELPNPREEKLIMHNKILRRMGTTRLLRNKQAYESTYLKLNKGTT